MPIVPLGVVASAEAVATNTISATLTADVGQTTPAQTAIALVIVQGAKLGIGVGNILTVTDDAPASESRYACYGYPVNPWQRAIGAEAIAAFPPYTRSQAIDGAAILALNALKAGHTVTVTITAPADYLRLTVLGYKGLRIIGDPTLAPPNNLQWGVNIPFFGADGGIRQTESGDGFTDGGFQAPNCWANVLADEAHNLTDFIVYWFSEFIGVWNGGVPIPPTSLTWRDAGVTLRESYYNKSAVPISTIIGDQTVVAGSGPFDTGGCTDVVPLGQFGTRQDDWMQMGSGYWQSGSGPIYCPAANRCQSATHPPCSRSTASHSHGSHCP